MRNLKTHLQKVVILNHQKTNYLKKRKSFTVTSLKCNQLYYKSFRRKLEQTPTTGVGRGRKKKVINSNALLDKEKDSSIQSTKTIEIPVQTAKQSSHLSPMEGHMTTEEIERHLQSRQSITELVPERAPPTVPNEMFSNEPSLDRYKCYLILQTKT